MDRSDAGADVELAMKPARIWQKRLEQGEVLSTQLVCRAVRLWTTIEHDTLAAAFPVRGAV